MNNKLCIHCGKTYTKKSSLEKHILICNIIHQTKRENKIQEQEKNDIPTTRQLLEIINTLVKKCDKLEAEVKDIQKIVSRKNKKINILEVLKEKQIPSLYFNNLIDSFNINQNYIEFLIKNTLQKTIEEIFKDTFVNNLIIQPITCFTHCKYVFYIYEDTESWREMTENEFLSFMNSLQRKMMNELNEWKKIHIEKIKKVDEYSDKYNQTIVKLMISFKENETLLKKIKINLFNLIKQDI